MRISGDRQSEPNANARRKNRNPGVVRTLNPGVQNLGKPLKTSANLNPGEAKAACGRSRPRRTEATAAGAMPRWRADGACHPGAVKVHQTTLTVDTRGRGFTDLTGKVEEVVRASGIATGLCTLFVKHTSASLTIQENADEAVRRDMQAWINRVIPEDGEAYEHDDEGLDDMPAHLRTMITRTSETIPIGDGALMLGTWQAIYLWEHRRTPHTRTLIVHVQGV